MRAGKKRTEALENTFIFAMIWSVCATVNEDGRASLDRFLRRLLAGEQDEGPGEDGEEGEEVRICNHQPCMTVIWRTIST